MWYTATVAEQLRAAHSYGFRVPGLTDTPAEQPLTFDWNALKTKRDAYITRLNGIYEKNLEKDNVDYHSGYARFKSAHEVEVERPDGSKYVLEAERIVIAVGGEPSIPDLPGAELGISSDGFFELETQPKRVAVVGAGYIAVEVRPPLASSCLTFLMTESLTLLGPSAARGHLPHVSALTSLWP